MRHRSHGGLLLVLGATVLATVAPTAAYAQRIAAPERIVVPSPVRTMIVDRGAARAFTDGLRVAPADRGSAAPVAADRPHGDRPSSGLADRPRGDRPVAAGDTVFVPRREALACTPGTPSCGAVDPAAAARIRAVVARAFRLIGP